VVEICAIQLRDRQYTIQYCNLMNQGCRGKDIVPFSSGHKGQQSPAIRSRIGESVVELSAIEHSITLVKRPLSEGLVGSSALMQQRCTLYRHVAGAEPNNIPQSDPESVNLKQLWRYPLWRSLSLGSKDHFQKSRHQQKDSPAFCMFCASDATDAGMQIANQNATTIPDNTHDATGRSA